MGSSIPRYRGRVWALLQAYLIVLNRTVPNSATFCQINTVVLAILISVLVCVLLPTSLFIDVLHIFIVYFLQIFSYLSTFYTIVA